MAESRDAYTQHQLSLKRATRAEWSFPLCVSPKLKVLPRAGVSSLEQDRAV